MAPLHTLSGIIFAISVTSCTAFVGAPPKQTVLRHGSSSVTAGAVAAPGVRSTEGLRATRPSFSTKSDDALIGRKAFPSVTSGKQRNTVSGPLEAVSGRAGEDLEDGGGKDLTVVRRALLLAIWLSFTAYAFGPWSPGATIDPNDIELVKHLYDPVTPQTAIYTGVFNALGVLPAVMASLLIGGGAFRKGRQPVPAQPFVFGAFALGFFSVGPYLALRNYLPGQAGDEEAVEASGVEKVLTSKVLAALLLVAAVSLDFSIVKSLADPEAVSGFTELFWSSKLAHISTLDFCVLSAVIVDPLREDMRRRGMEPELAKVALFSVPLVGPTLWMLVRPPVQR